MFGATRFALLSNLLLLAATLVPSSAYGSIQHSSIALDKRQSAFDSNRCWTEFDQHKECIMLQVAWFQDTECNTPYKLSLGDKKAMIKGGNTELLFDGGLSRTVTRPFGSLRIVGAVPGVGLGFAKNSESHTVVQNMALMNSAEVYKAYRAKSCVTFPNLDFSRMGVWTVRMDNIFNQGGYVWNPFNIPIKKNVAECRSGNGKRAINKRHGHSHARGRASEHFCLEPASWGLGGVIELYDTEDCSGVGKMQSYNTVQCTPLITTGFKSYKAISPQGEDVETIFSPVYYDLSSETGYHACAQKDITARPFKPNQCQKFAANDMFVGIYSNDPDPKLAMPGPSPGDKILRQSHGHLLLGPHPKHGATHQE